ncbi:MAG: chromosomal replication initiator protein DnaA [Frisingicoccus sp.]|uniref:chromosomal replication initiator protein DnaA n=1 Tax=Frisingicoccus sp. TaxID=1918627 RepID=UPI00262B9465|nr:chromosomal replication initiator protein DnaA [Frisingicoccus sp.]MDD6232063.1 chromosomal replication initiator protein DnaA [Frisingicoccus sp.]
MLPIIKEKWNEILELMKIENDIAEVAFTTWVIHFKPYKVEGNMLTVSVEKENLVLDANWFSKKFRMPLIISIAEVLETEFDVRFIIPDGTEEDSVIEEESKADSSEVNTHLNPRYTFDTFVVGKNNDIAHATALAVAEDPGTYGNPLFIYGGAGLGKTHLLHSMAHYVLSKHPDYRIIYVTSEEFTNELVRSIQHKQGESFKNKYRNIDMLLIDDIQFIVNKESTQEEFFHTFTTLYESKKQIVISSDKPPKDINGLEDRLITRFKAGLTVDIQPPNYETRMAILKKRAELDNIKVDDESLNYIATNIKSSIRELEGALKQIYNFSRLRKQTINFNLTKEALENIISPEEKRPVTCELIIETVAEHFNISPDDIKSTKRNKEIAYPRQICMYLCRKMTADSLQAVGNSLGKKDHTTIIHGEKKISDDLKKDENLQNTIDVLIKKINPPK